MRPSASPYLYRPIIRLCRQVSGLLVVLGVVMVAGVAELKAQSQAELEQRRIRLETQLSNTARLLSNSSRTKEAALGRLSGIQQKIIQREELISLLRLQVAHADKSLGRTEGVLNSMQADIDTLTAEYGRMARAALRQNLLQGRWSYLLNADGLSDAFARIQYLKRYDENRRRQLSLIQSTQEALAAKVTKLDAIKLQKQQLIDEEVAQQSLLEAELAEKNQLIEELKGDEARLRKEFTAQAEQKEELDRAIGEIISLAKKDAESRLAQEAKQQAARAKRAAELAADAKKTTPPSPSTTTKRSESVSSTGYTAALSSDFSTNRGRLPWPVEKGFVSKPFGTRAHPTLSNVQVNNNGVDIRTDPGAPVKAVFEGEVVGLQTVPGYNTMVILQHGNYYTVYSNLVNVLVKQGARVGTADVLGSVAYDELGAVSELHFEVWRDKQTQNPSSWVKGLK